MSRGALEIQFNQGSGNLSATFSIQGSISKASGTFQDLGISVAPAAGSAGCAQIDLSAYGHPFVQVVVTQTGGSGPLVIWGSGKSG